MIIHQKLLTTIPAAADLAEAEGCFVKADGSLTAASATPANVFGLIVHSADKDAPLTVALPGFGGIVQVNSTSAVSPGDYLVPDTNGRAKVASSGTVLAVAVEAAPAGLVAARLIQPVTIA